MHPFYLLFRLSDDSHHPHGTGRPGVCATLCHHPSHRVPSHRCLSSGNAPSHILRFCQREDTVPPAPVCFSHHLPSVCKLIGPDGRRAVTFNALATLVDVLETVHLPLAEA